MNELRSDADQIIQHTLHTVMPDAAVQRALQKAKFSQGRLFLVAIGKAGWQMAKAAVDILGTRINHGIVITKYHHALGVLPNIDIYEAGHPIPDENSFAATEKVIHLVSGFSEKDTVLFLVSGGGSALFEKPLIEKEKLVDITNQLLRCGADITQINTIRKRLSAVKAGRFAKLCEPAHVFTIVLSDIIGDPLDMIASGPAYVDNSISKQAIEIIEQYGLQVDDEIQEVLRRKTPKVLNNVETHITGSVSQLCIGAKYACEQLGYQTDILTNRLCCTARDAGSFLASIAGYRQATHQSLAFIAGGETVVKLMGTGLGGRNQELALAAAEGIAGYVNTAIFSIGSDGTDGPTDAAGGYVDHRTRSILHQTGISIPAVLADNDSYRALQKCGGLIHTGPTGTNVNDVAVLLIKRMSVNGG